MEYTKVTLTLPEQLVKEYKQLVGERKISLNFLKLIKEDLRKRKWDKFQKQSMAFAKELDKTGRALSVQEVISAYKSDRK